MCQDFHEIAGHRDGTLTITGSIPQFASQLGHQFGSSGNAADRLKLNDEKPFRVPGACGVFDDCVVAVSLEAGFYLLGLLLVHRNEPSRTMYR